MGKRIEVVAQSSYVETLTAARGKVPDLAWTEDPTADAGELLDRVARGEADYTLVDSNLFAIYQRYHPELRVAFNMTEGDALAWAFQRRGDRSLIDEAAAYLAGIRASGQLAHVMDRYYGHKATFDYAGTRKFMRDYQQLLPRYRKQFEAAAERAGIDWRLIAAVGYQESHWDPDGRLAEGRPGHHDAHARDRPAHGHRESHGRGPEHRRRVEVPVAHEAPDREALAGHPRPGPHLDGPRRLQHGLRPPARRAPGHQGATAATRTGGST